MRTHKRLALISALVVSVTAVLPCALAAERSAMRERPAPIRYQRGMVIKAEGGAFRNILGTRTVPMDWPDQQVVRVVQEDLAW